MAPTTGWSGSDEELCRDRASSPRSAPARCCLIPTVGDLDQVRRVADLVGEHRPSRWRR